MEQWNTYEEVCENFKYLTQNNFWSIVFTNSLSTGYVFLKLFRYFFSQLFHGLFIFHKGYNLLDGLSSSKKIMGFD